MRLRTLLRIILLTLLTLFVIASVTFATARIRRHTLRRGAELLLRDMLTINLRETTFQDVQPLFRRWRRWGKFDDSCTALHCAFTISLSKIDTPLNQFLYLHPRVFGSASFIGEPPTAINARVIVLNGRVWGETISFGMEIRDWYDDGKLFFRIVSGEATSVARTELLRRGRNWRVHPEYAIWWPTNQQDEVRFDFTPFTNPADVHRLMALDFSCLTSGKLCTNKKDIMPPALKQVASWSSLPDPSDQNIGCEDPDPLALLQWARDARHVVVVKVGPRRPARGYKPELHLFERPLALQNVLKTARPSGEFLPSTLWMFEFPGSKASYHEGDSAILFLKDDNFDGYSLEGCSPLPATTSYLSIVNRGIAQDTRRPGLPDFAVEALSH